MNTTPNNRLDLQVQDRGFHPRHPIATLATRWIARMWGIASALLLLAFAFSGGEHLRFTAHEAVEFMLFPIGVIAGFVLAWRRELAGGLLTVGCYSAFCLLLHAWSGRVPGGYFLLFAAPGFLHIASSLLARRTAKTASGEPA